MSESVSLSKPVSLSEKMAQVTCLNPDLSVSKRKLPQQSTLLHFHIIT